MVGSIERVRAALEADGVETYLMPAGTDRTAVMPREDEDDIVNTDVLAQAVSANHGLDAMAQAVSDSDFVYLSGYRDGRSVFRYRSDEAAESNSVAAIARYGVGQVDLRRLTAVLLDDPEIVGRMRGEDQHVEILGGWCFLWGLAVGLVVCQADRR